MATCDRPLKYVMRLAQFLQYVAWSDAMRFEANIGNVALPVWMGRISPLFDTARRLLLVKGKDGREAGRYEMIIDESCLLRRVRKLAESGADALICGGISRSCGYMVSAAGIEIISFVTGPVDDVLDAYFSGKLSDPRFLMPGCRRRGTHRYFGSANTTSRRGNSARGGHLRRRQGQGHGEGAFSRARSRPAPASDSSTRSRSNESSRSGGGAT